MIRLLWGGVNAPELSKLGYRRHPRQAVDRPAKIFLSGGEGLVCRIRDVSKGGAKIRIAWTGWLPDSFDLEDSFTKARREVWGSGEKHPTSGCALPTRDNGPRPPSPKRLAGDKANDLLTEAAQSSERRRGGETLCRPENLQEAPSSPMGPFACAAASVVCRST